MPLVGEQKRQYDREWMRQRRESWFAANGPCVDCGSRERLEIDHKDRTTKISHRVWSWSEQRRDAELAKCVVRCHTCHRKKTNPEMRAWLQKPSLEERQKEMRERMLSQKHSPRSVTKYNQPISAC